jgi:serine phosphatase RsbU (regulator of sigma subunit)
MKAGKDKRYQVRVSMLTRILLSVLVAGLVPLFVCTIIMLQLAERNNQAAIKTATEGADQAAFNRLQILARTGAAEIVRELEGTAQHVLSVSFMPREIEAYRYFYDTHRETILYPTGTADNVIPKREEIYRYREMALIDASGQERIKIVNGRLLENNELRNISDPANTTYKTETYFADTKPLPRGDIWITNQLAWHTSLPNQPSGMSDPKFLGTNYNKYEAIYRISTPLYDRNNNFEGIVVLSLDARVLIERVIHIVPVGEAKENPWPAYNDGSYGFVWDNDGYLTMHPLLQRYRAFDANGKVLPDWKTPSANDDNSMFRMPIGEAPRPRMYENTMAGQEGLEVFVSGANTERSVFYTPIKYNKGVYKKTNGIFGAMAVGAAWKSFKAEAYQVRDFLQQNQENSRNTALLVAGGSFLVLLLMAILLSSSITLPVTRLTHAIRQAQDGELDEKRLEKVLNRRTRDEVTVLGLTFRQMASTVREREEELRTSNEKLEEYSANLESEVERRTEQLANANAEITTLNKALKAENVRLSAEVEITRQLQQMILPKENEFKAIEGLDIAGYMSPADEVGGDYYDVLYDNGQVKIGIGDVTGHGLESGVLMLMVQTAVRTLLTSDVKDPQEFLSILNRTIYGNLQRMHSDKNLTLSLLDYKNGQLRLSGQHEEMIIVRQQGDIELVDTIDLGFPIGLEEDIRDFVSQREVQLVENDIVILYTDGITEAENIEGKQYGIARLCEVVRANAGLGAKGIKTAVIEDLLAFIGTQKIYDDITLLVLKQKPVGEVASIN